MDATTRGDHVQPIGREGDLLHARVRGRHPTPYEVTVGVDAIGPTGTTSCTCGWNPPCKHVALVLEAFRAEPDAFPPLDPGPPLLPAGVLRWAEERDAVHLLATPLREVLRTYVPRHLDVSVGAYFGTGDAMGVGREHQARRRDVIRWVMETAKAHRAARRFEREAEAWRAVRPREEALVPLWRWLRDVTRAERTGAGPTAPIRADQLVVDGDPPCVVVHVGHRTASIRIAPVAGDPPPDRTAAEAVLDLLGHPSLADAPVRHRLALEAGRPPWDRAVAALDRAIGLVERRPPGHDASRQFGWKVEPRGPGVRVEPAWFWPDRRGLRAARCELRDVPGELPQDRLLADLLVRSRPHEEGLALVALRLLTGHPRVLYGKANDPVAVCDADLELHWLPTDDGGVRAEPRVLGVPLDDAALERLIDTTSGHHALWVDPGGKRLAVLSLSTAALRLLQELDVRGTTWPREAVGAVLARVPDLGRVVPLHLHGDLRGEEVDGDPTPFVRLDPRHDGTLDVEVRLRPLDPGPVVVPGHGADEVAAVHGGRRVYVVRDRDAEVARVRALLAPLALPDEEAFAWRIVDPDAVLDVVRALQALEGVRVEWSGRIPSFLPPIDPHLVTLRAAEEPRSWFAVEGEAQVDGEILPLRHLLAMIRQHRRYVQVREGVWTTIADKLRDRLAAVAAVGIEDDAGLTLPPLAASALAGLEEDGATLDVPPAWREREARMREAATLDVALPGGLRAELRPYQRDGYEWLARLAHWAPGGVLADDMGLGKTVQALALVLRRAALGPTLVVAPASVELNWEREVARFAPSLRVVRHRGAKRGQRLADLGPNDLVIASWALLRRDAALAAVAWATVVLDEAQAIKTPTAAVSKAAATLTGGGLHTHTSSNVRGMEHATIGQDIRGGMPLSGVPGLAGSRHFTLALTGTPVENHAGDLWSLFRAVVPGLLGPFEVYVARLREALDGSTAGARAAVAALIRPFVLRRLKRDVAIDLPARTEVVVPIELSAVERRRYEELRASAEATLASAGREDRMLVLAALTRLRQLACAIRLVDPDSGEPSSKLERLVEILRDLKEQGHRALVFSQFTSLLDLAEEALDREAISVRRLDGDVPVARRMTEVDAFQRGDGDAFLISLKAGGVGLNLTAASYVVHLDPWWNPAAEDQATDRAHRIGQTLPVTVLKLVAVDTIEEQVLMLHRDKRRLVQDLLAGTDSIARMTPDELLALLS